MTHKYHGGLDVAIYIKSALKERLNHIFKKAPNPLLQDLTEDEIEEMMREADLDGDGKDLFK